MSDADSNADSRQQKLASAIMTAIVHAQISEVDGEPIAFVQPVETIGALLTCLGTLLESSPTCRTPKGVRETTAEIAKGLQHIIRETRVMREAGEAPFDPEVIHLN